MDIKITDKILSIPPYVSTSWSRIAALYMKGGLLVITLVDGDSVQIPDLNAESIRTIFQHHALYLDKEENHLDETGKDLSSFKEMMQQGETSIRFAVGSSMDGLEGMMQHNPDQKDSPDLPPEILQKIGAIAKIVSPSEEMLLPQAEMGCNCLFCQIARALHPEPSFDVVDAEEPIALEHDLHFPDWDIQQTGDKLYSVINKLDDHEKYNVYLGEPIGCTCGKQNCEHILAVLKS